ncbi:MAG: hypothetical protein FJ404_19605 [Verrucomicrobia bacterium]|nr:hypothetical protein [Verrucomicrobiota bacterium]
MLPNLFRKPLALVLTATACFHAALAFPPLSFLVLVYLACLLELRHQAQAKFAFRWGTLAGLLTFGPQLGFLYNIFSYGAVALWLILALWIGLFAAVVHACHRQLGNSWALILSPFLSQIHG